MTTQPPPPRYRVVEQGRRLVVIDTLTGAPATRSISESDILSRAAGRGRAGALRRSTAARHPRTDHLARAIGIILAGGATSHEGHPIVQTKAFYDDKAPRDLVLDTNAQHRISYAVAGLFALVAIAGLIVVTEPAVLVVVFPLASSAVQGWLRRRVTHWLDEIEASAET